MEAKPVKVTRVIEYWYENVYWAWHDRANWVMESTEGTKIKHKTVSVTDPVEVPDEKKAKQNGAAT